MVSYMEQTVKGSSSAASKALYVLAWIVLVLSMIGAVIAAASLLAGIEGGASFSIPDAIILVLAIAAAVVVYRRKDRLRIEYDYAIRDGRLEVAAVLNNRRRVPKLRLELERILACGRGNPSDGGAKLEKLYLNEDAELTYFCYEEKGERRMALLELNEDMIAYLRRSRDLQRGTWRE